MPIDVVALTSLAADYAAGMPPIRGRRVQRLLKREFAGAEHVLIVDVAAAGRAVLGVSDSGAGFCATDGRGREASVLRWSHGATAAVETRFDLLKDSLPVLGTRAIALARLPRRADLHIPPGSAPREAARLVEAALRALT